MTTNDKMLHERMKTSARDFWDGVRPSLENQLQAKILPLEQLQSNEAIKAFDQAGIDAFYIDQQKNLRGLASRMNYSLFANAPAFTFRYALWDERSKGWNYDREYQRKLKAANHPERFIFFPELHVESFCEKKDAARLITWSYVARTQAIVNYIQANLQDRKKVHIFEPKRGEKRQVVIVNIDAFAKDHDVTEVRMQY